MVFIKIIFTLVFLHTFSGKINNKSKNNKLMFSIIDLSSNLKMKTLIITGFFNFNFKEINVFSIIL